MALLDREDREDDWRLRDSEMALLDINKMLVEILMAAGLVNQETLEHMLIEPLAKYDQRKMPNARVVTDLLLAFIRDPRRVELRERLRSRLGAQAVPPQ
jgi:hypothetical protein